MLGEIEKAAGRRAAPWPLALAGAGLRAEADRVLYWPAERMLCVSDLHLGRFARGARSGGAVLPPFDVIDTLARLAAAVERLAPRLVVSLGDSFDDDLISADLAPEARRALSGLMRGRDWVWVTGNHDPAPAKPGGDVVDELPLGALIFRHQAVPGPVVGEVSGHFHPKFRVPGGSRALCGPCFVADAARIMMPAFGTYTGGLWTDAPQIRGLFGGAAMAVLTGTRLRAVPLA